MTSNEIFKLILEIGIYISLGVLIGMVLAWIHHISSDENDD
jgi:NhaP-type Na+/H+ or K+/H+ antiporter